MAEPDFEAHLAALATCWDALLEGGEVDMVADETDAISMGKGLLKAIVMGYAIATDLGRDDDINEALDELEAAIIRHATNHEVDHPMVDKIGKKFT